MKITPVQQIEINNLGDLGIIKTIGGGLYIYTCKFIPSDNTKNIPSDEFYESHLKRVMTLFCGDIIYYWSNAPIFFLEEDDRVT